MVLRMCRVLAIWAVCSLAVLSLHVVATRAVGAATSTPTFTGTLAGDNSTDGDELCSWIGCGNVSSSGNCSCTLGCLMSSTLPCCTDFSAACLQATAPPTTEPATNDFTDDGDLCDVIGCGNISSNCSCASECQLSTGPNVVCCLDFFAVCTVRITPTFSVPTQSTTSPVPGSRDCFADAVNGTCDVFMPEFDCQCDQNCTRTRSCCPSYAASPCFTTPSTAVPTVVPTSQPEILCSVALCGFNDSDAECSCASDCGTDKKCCSDYDTVCQVGTPPTQTSPSATTGSQTAVSSQPVQVTTSTTGQIVATTMLASTPTASPTTILTSSPPTTSPITTAAAATTAGPSTPSSIPVTTIRTTQAATPTATPATTLQITTGSQATTSTQPAVTTAFTSVPSTPTTAMPATTVTPIPPTTGSTSLTSTVPGTATTAPTTTAAAVTTTSTASSTLTPTISPTSTTAMTQTMTSSPQQTMTSSPTSTAASPSSTTMAPTGTLATPSTATPTTAPTNAATTITMTSSAAMTQAMTSSPQQTVTSSPTSTSASTSSTTMAPTGTLVTPSTATPTTAPTNTATTIAMTTSTGIPISGTASQATGSTASSTTMSATTANSSVSATVAVTNASVQISSAASTTSAATSTATGSSTAQATTLPVMTGTPMTTPAESTSGLTTNAPQSTVAPTTPRTIARVRSESLTSAERTNSVTLVIEMTTTSQWYASYDASFSAAIIGLVESDMRESAATGRRKRETVARPVVVYISPSPTQVGTDLQLVFFVRLANNQSYTNTSSVVMANQGQISDQIGRSIQNGSVTSGVPSDYPTASTGDSSSNAGAIAGGIIGGLVALALVALIVIVVRRIRHHGRYHVETTHFRDSSGEFDRSSTRMNRIGSMGEKTMDRRGKHSFLDDAYVAEDEENVRLPTNKDSVRL